MIYRIGDCELDAGCFELRRGGETVAVEPQVLELLLYLVERRDRAVTRTELFERLWRGRIVTDSALNSRIKAARSALGDDGASQAQIRTLHRTGYRFVGRVEEVSDAHRAAAPEPAAMPLASASPTAPPETAPTTAAQPLGGSTIARPSAPPLARRLGLVGAALGLVLAVGAFSLLPRAAHDAGVSSAASPATAPAMRADHGKTLAVLPFTNLSPDAEDEYFADSIGVELRKVMSHYPDLRVSGLTSSVYFKDRNDPPRVIGEMLGVEHLLTGSVRKAGERIRIAVELVEAANGYQLWADSYERELGDIFEVQDEIAAHVATALQVKLGLGESGELGMTRNVAAYDAFLRGYAAYNEHSKEAFSLAIEHMHRAIALDPGFSRAWAYLYCIYLDGANLVPERAEEWTRKAVEALEEARRVTPDSPFVSILSAREDMRFGRLLEARAALEALPAGYWTADRFVTRDVFLGRFLITTGHANEAVETLERAHAADPLSPVVALYLSLAHAAAGDTTQALAEVDRGVTLGALRPILNGNAMLVALATRDADEIRVRVAATQSSGANRAINDALVARLGDAAAGRAELRRIASAPAEADYLRSVLIAHWAAYYGDAELALDELDDIAHGAVDEALLWRAVLADVRRLPGFKELARREGLVDYWRVYGWPALCEPTTADDFECG